MGHVVYPCNIADQLPNLLSFRSGYQYKNETNNTMVFASKLYCFFSKFSDINGFMFVQVIGLTLVYNSSYFREASFSCCVILILLYNFPKAVLERGKRYW